MRGKVTAENKRLDSFTGPHNDHPWLHWGPYLSERSWGTVREDYSTDGNAWAYFPHDHARSKAYRRGEDGLAGISDRYQRLNFSLALWNTKDSILKERIFGLVPYETNHGEDVKDYYFYLDSTPTHSYMKYLYKYPQEEFPYKKLVEESQKRTIEDREYELLDTGIFDKNRYFDVFVEYAKASEDDMCIRITIENRSEEEASIHVLPQLWYRNSWDFGVDKTDRRPSITLDKQTQGHVTAVADDSMLGPEPRLTKHYVLGSYYFYAEGAPEALFTNNDTNNERIYQKPNNSPFVKDAFHRYVINQEDCVNPEHTGTKMCYHFGDIKIPGKGKHVIRLRLSDKKHASPFKDHEKIFSKRIEEAEHFYENVHPVNAPQEEKMIQRQAFAGMLWSKQFYMFDISSWAQEGYFGEPPPEGREEIRNKRWKQINCKQILSMPDKWEYPWFAAWDLAFHTISLAQVDIELAKHQLGLLLFEGFMHPNGQIPAYEWEFSDLNPPVHAWAVWQVFQEEVRQKGKGDRTFLSRCYHKLLMNFCWWVNKVDQSGNNVFEGGFLGLDNISVIDRSETLPNGERIEQSDGTGWMGLFSLMMMRLSLQLAKQDSYYEELAVKFFEHFVLIGASMETHDERKAQMWNKEDGFFYDVVSYPDGEHKSLKVRSIVGLIPLFAVDALTEEELKEYKTFARLFGWFLHNKEEQTKRCVTKVGDKYILAMMHLEQARSLLQYVWSEEEFRSTYGLRSLSKYHEKHPFEFEGHVVGYEPGEETRPLKGGNSNWRGPIWFPTTYILLQALQTLQNSCAKQVAIEDNGTKVPITQIIETISKGLLNLFKKDKSGRRPAHGDYEMFQTDPHWQDLILFYEHYHGDNGRGLGANHQTGWSGLITKIIADIYK